MKTVAYAAAVLMMAGTASAQSASGSDLTRMLNGTPPAAAPRATAPPATRPATTAPAPTETRPAAPATTTPPRTTPSAATPAPRPSTTTPAAGTPARATSAPPATTAARPSATTPAAVTPPRATPTRPASIPAARSSATTPVPTAPTRTAPPAGTTARPAPTTPPAAAPASPPPASPTVLNASAVAALPFTVDLPSTFQITTGRPGPNFNVYAIRKGGQSFVTVYVGPSSQFPIYTGETVQLSGRSSIVVAEEGRRRAVEHLFRREDPALEIHAWVSSLEGADRNQAEQIAQSISPR